MVEDVKKITFAIDILLLLCLNVNREFTKVIFRKGGEKMKLDREKINLQLARRCYTITDLAKTYGVSRARINAILNQREVTYVVAGRMAQALGVDVTEILED